MDKIYIETLGCSKNQVDSEKMLYLLEESGYEIVDDPEIAEIIIVNTCGFILSAKQEAIETILELLEYKETGVCKKIIAAGCLAQRYFDEIKKEIPEIDAVFGVGDISRILEAVKNNGIIKPGYSKKEKLIKRKILNYPGSAYLKISDGCSNYCSYCAIPKIRGDLRSRSIEDILKEVRFLKTLDVKEYIIIAQDTANYGYDLYNKRSLADLVKQINEIIDDDSWIRVLYMHPDHIDEILLKELAGINKFIPYFDIPFQSGSSKILKSMNRSGSSGIYLDLINTIKSIFKESVIRSTFIAGFPGESDEDFEQTIAFIKKAGIDWIGGFVYSNEEDTAAFELEDQVSENIKQERLDYLYEAADEITSVRLNRFLNTVQDILIEERVEEEELFIGRFWGQAPDVDGLTVVNCEDVKPGNFLKTRIVRLNDKDFYGKIV